MVTDEMQDTVEEASGMSETLGENVCDDGQDEREAIEIEINGETHVYTEPLTRFTCPKKIWITAIATIIVVIILSFFMINSIKDYRRTTEWQYHVRMTDLFSLAFGALDSPYGNEPIADSEESEIMKYVVDAYNKADEGYPYSAILDLDNHLMEYPDGGIMAVAAMDIAMEHRDYENAGYYLDCFPSEGLGFKVIDRRGEYIDELNAYWKVTDVIDEEWDAFYDKADYSDSYDEVINTIIARLKELEGNPEANQAILYSYLGDYSSDYEEALGYYKKSVELDGKMSYPASVVAIDMRKKGEYDEAEKMLLELCDWDKENAYTSRVLASIYLLENRNEEALSYAKRAYDNFAEGNYVAETYAIALHANGMQDECESICELIERNEYYANENFKLVVNGKMSIEEYYSE